LGGVFGGYREEREVLIRGEYLNLMRVLSEILEGVVLASPLTSLGEQGGFIQVNKNAKTLVLSLQSPSIEIGANS
jgi:hypothetical protein